MSRKVQMLSDALMNVGAQADIPPRIEAERQKGSEPERQKGRSEPLVGLNFKVRKSFRREFQRYCFDHEMSQVEALTTALALLKKGEEPK